MECHSEWWMGLRKRKKGYWHVKTDLKHYCPVTLSPWNVPEKNMTRRRLTLYLSATVSLFCGLNLFPMWSFLVLHFPLCCGKWLHGSLANEDHLSRQHILQGIKKSLKSLQVGAACLPQGLVGILAYWLAVILFSNHVGSQNNINYP